MPIRRRLRQVRRMVDMVYSGLWHKGRWADNSWLELFVGLNKLSDNSASA